MRFITLALGHGDTKISKTFHEGLYDIRINCYPPCPEPEQVLGIDPHANNSRITLLVDFGDFQGLQFLKDGKWINVEPIEGAIVANIGHIMEIEILNLLELLKPELPKVPELPKPKILKVPEFPKPELMDYSHRGVIVMVQVDPY
ncbi:oxoglutarate-dependent flavonoid 7-O-demethylase 1-like [Vicia villosa]|uniref:oxoglutarate-dependent flavonoid 7-O-demethylase 1-like n=1 Tax=Vicia villosa TaxID=3911 RepID=UPI00273C02B4|nr:oxoglutarate-dependent flavonoid 7-O-demethylase 1-like [Vicia villosa]